MELRFAIVPHGRLADGSGEVNIRRLMAALQGATDLLVDEVKQRTPAGATGRLRGSITALPVSQVGNELVSQIGAGVDYAMAVEAGSAPHMPPLEPLLHWVESKLSVHRSNTSGRRRKKNLVQTKVWDEWAAPAFGGRVGRRGKVRKMAVGAARTLSVDAEVLKAAEAIRWSIYHRGTSAAAAGAGGHSGPTGGIGYFMFERAWEENESRIQREFFEPLGLGIVRDFE